MEATMTINADKELSKFYAKEKRRRLAHYGFLILVKCDKLTFTIYFY